MEIEQVRVFLEVARLSSFTEAAKTLRLTQPAISSKIKALESEIGASLFLRSGKKVMLTNEGRYLFQEGYKLINLEQSLVEQIETIKEDKQKKMNIGLMSNLVQGWFSETILSFCRENRYLKVDFFQFNDLKRFYEALIRNEIQLGFSESDFAETSDLNARQTVRNCFFIYTSPEHPLASREWVNLEELCNYSWVILTSGSPNRTILESRLMELGLSLDTFPNLECINAPELIRHYIFSGNYIYFGSTFDFELENRIGLITSIPIQEFALNYSIFMLYKRDLERSCPELEKLSAYIKTDQDYDSSTDLTSPTFRAPIPYPLLNNCNRSKTKKLNVGTQNSTIPVASAGITIKQLRLFEHFLFKRNKPLRDQIDIEWKDFSHGAPIVEGLNSHQLDIGILGDYPLLLSALNCETHLVSFISNNTNGTANAILVPNNSNIKDISDLRESTIAVPFGSSAHSMVVRELYELDLLKDIYLHYFESFSKTLSHWNINKTESLACFTPFHEIARRDSNFRLLFSGNSSGLPVFYGVVVRKELVENSPDIVIAYLESLIASQNWLIWSPSATSLISQWTHLDPEIVCQTLGDSSMELGRFAHDINIRKDWIEDHIKTLAQIENNDQLNNIDLERWIVSDLLDKATNSYYVINPFGK